MPRLKLDNFAHVDTRPETWNAASTANCSAQVDPTGMSPALPKSTSPSRSGIAVSSSGQRHIPSSIRADGTVRREIRVRPGYRPPEDVEVYKNHIAEAWKNRGAGGVPGAEASEPEKAPSQAASKNAKRREARKKAAAIQDHLMDSDVPNGTSSAKLQEPLKPIPVDPVAEKEKEAKKLSKKLRQARELKEKKDNGGSLLPEQFDKVIKMNELIRQLDNLGFDANGDMKPVNTEE